MSKTAKPSTNAKNSKNDPKLMAILNSAENSKRNTYIFSNQIYSTFVAREIVNYLVDKGAEILHSNYLMRQKMPHYLSEIYTMNIKEVVEVDKICHDINDPSNPYKRYEEDTEPLSIPMDNYMTDWIKTGQKKSITSTIETKPVEPKPPLEKKQKFGRQKIQTKPSAAQPSPSEATNRSNNPLNRESLNSSQLVKTQRRSKSNIPEASLPSNNKKSILRENFNRLVPLPQPKIFNDEVIERFRQEQARLIEDERLKKKEATDIAEAKIALKKKIDLLEKSVFKKEYTYDFNGDIIEVKNRHPPKKAGFHMNLGFQVEYDQRYLERVDTRQNPEQGIMYEVEESKGPPVFRYKPKSYGKSATKVVEIDEELFKYEELLRTYGLIGYGPFDPSKVTEKMLNELEKKRQQNIIDYITPQPGVKIIEKERVKENTTAVPKYSESGFPLITKSIYENLQDKSYDEIKYLNINEMNDTKDFEKALLEKERRFRKLLDGLYPPQKKLQNKTRKISEIASYLDINPLESQDLDQNNRTITQRSNKENDRETGGTNRTGKSSHRSNQKNLDKSFNQIKFGEGIQERIEVLKDLPRRGSAADRAVSTPSKPLFSDTKKHYMEKYYGKEEIFAKRKNRQYSTASKIPRVKKPDDSDHNKSAIIGSTEHAGGAPDISMISYANKSYMDEFYDTNKRVIHDRLNINDQNLLQLLSEN